VVQASCLSAVRRMQSLWLALLALALLAAPAHADLVIDPPDKPNEDIQELMGRLAGGAMPLPARAEYFAHYSPVVRRAASFSLMREGQKAMPLILEALKAKDRRVLRAGCDALCGPFGVGMVGRGRKELQAVMTPDIAGQAVPHLIKLLDHPDLYVRDGALLALSNCGKAAAPHLDRIAKFRDDPDWWLRSGASTVIKNIGPPESDRYAEDMTRTFLAEQRVYAKRRYMEMAAQFIQTSGKNEQVLQLVSQAMLTTEHAYYRWVLIEALSNAGPKAAPAPPAIATLIAKHQTTLKETKDAKLRGNLEREVATLEKLHKRLAPKK